jgi:hypothetical protein
MEREGSLPYSQVPATCPRSISPGPRLSVWTLRYKMRFYGDELLEPRPTLKLEDHPLSAVRDCILGLFSTFAAVLHIGSRSSSAPCRGDGPTYLRDNRQHPQETDILPPARFEPAIPASERQQTAWYSNTEKWYIAFTDACNSHWFVIRTLHCPVGQL